MKSLGGAFYKAMIARRIGSRLHGLSGQRVRLRLAETQSIGTEYEIRLLKKKGLITYLVNPDYMRKHKSTYKNGANAHIFWFSKADPGVTEISCDISDGDMPGLAQFSYSTCFEGKTLVPDHYFLRYRGYEAMDRLALQAPAWQDRKNGFFWRGFLNNAGLFSTDEAHVDAPWVMQRIRFAMKARDIPGIDVRFVEGPVNPQPAQLRAAGLFGPRRPPEDWAGDKFAFDIDGHSNAWSNLMQRLKLGCCVLKVESQFGFRQWYYHQLVPFEHFVPVKADLSDLAEKVDWVKSHDKEAEAIAANGQALARSMTFESETLRAARIIEENWASGAG